MVSKCRNNSKTENKLLGSRTSAGLHWQYINRGSKVQVVCKCHRARDVKHAVQSTHVWAEFVAVRPRAAPVCACVRF